MDTPPLPESNLETMLKTIASHLTRLGRIKTSDEDGYHRLDIEVHEERNNFERLVVIESPSGSMIVGEAEYNGNYYKVSPARLVNHYLYPVPDEAPPADPRIVAALNKLDATTLYSLRGGGTYHPETYEALSCLGSHAPIHRLLAKAPAFGRWLEIREIEPRWIDETEEADQRPILTGLHAADDPLAWIVAEIVAYQRRVWPDHRTNHRAVRELATLVVETDPDITDLWFTPHTLGFLAMLPASLRPRNRESFQDALAYANRVYIRCHILNPFEPTSLFAMLTGDWKADTKRLVSLEETHSCDLSGHHYSTLHEIIKRAIYPVEIYIGSGLSETLAQIIEIRLRRLCDRDRPLSEILEHLRDHPATTPMWPIEPAGPDTPPSLKVWMESPYLTPELRGLSPRAFLTALGFDVAAIARLYTEPRTWNAHSLQAQILKTGARSRRFTRQRGLPTIPVFHTATFQEVTYYARMTPSGPIVSADPWGKNNLLEYLPGRYAIIHASYGEPDTRCAHLAFLHAEFGLAARMSDAKPWHAHDFYRSPAAQGLVRWITRNPQAARHYATQYPASRTNAVLGDWYYWALTEKRAAARKAD